jgi:hypothetical protein
MCDPSEQGPQLKLGKTFPALHLFQISIVIEVMFLSNGAWQPGTTMETSANWDPYDKTVRQSSVVHSLSVEPYRPGFIEHCAHFQTDSLVRLRFWKSNVLESTWNEKILEPELRRVKLAKKMWVMFDWVSSKRIRQFSSSCLICDVRGDSHERIERMAIDSSLSNHWPEFDNWKWSVIGNACDARAFSNNILSILKTTFVFVYWGGSSLMMQRIQQLSVSSY